jgi:hypothetical protein
MLILPIFSVGNIEGTDQCSETCNDVDRADDDLSDKHLIKQQPKGIVKHSFSTKSSNSGSGIEWGRHEVHSAEPFPCFQLDPARGKT